MPEDKLPYVYSLTDVTGRKAGYDRTTLTPVFKMQVKWVTFRSAIIALAPTLPLAALLAPLMGAYALIAGAVVWGACMGLLLWRSKELDESLAKTIYNRYKDKPGTVFIAGQEAYFGVYEGIIAPHV